MAKLAAAYEYSDAELLALYREALAAISLNQNYTLRGKTYTRADLAAVRDMIEWLEVRVNLAATTSRVVIGRHVRSNGRSPRDIEFYG